MVHQNARLLDAEAEAKMKSFNDRKLKAKASQFKLGDLVLLKWKRSCKEDTLFDPSPFKIFQ